MRARGATGAVLAAALAGAALILAGAGSVARAQATADDTPAALARVYACAQTSDERERLACYDAAVGRLRQAETGGEFVAVDRARVAEVERDSFGFNLPSLARLVPRFNFNSGAAAGAGATPGAAGAATSDDGDDSLDQLAGVIERVAPRSNGYHAFYLTNGQVWAQLEAQRAGNVRAGDNVTIRRAAMGSFRLVSERGGAGHRVRREE